MKRREMRNKRDAKVLKLLTIVLAAFNQDYKKGRFSVVLVITKKMGIKPRPATLALKLL